MTETWTKKLSDGEHSFLFNDPQANGQILVQEFAYGHMIEMYWSDVLRLAEIQTVLSKGGYKRED